MGRLFYMIVSTFVVLLFVFAFKIAKGDIVFTAPDFIGLEVPQCGDAECSAFRPVLGLFYLCAFLAHIIHLFF